MAYTFDGPNKLVILTAGTTSINLSELYSRWKDWVHIGDNAKYIPFFSTVGGEDIDPVEGTKVPLYLIQNTGVNIRPQEASHTLSVVGGTLVKFGGGDPFTNTLGSYIVRIRYQQPVQAIGYSAGGGGTAPSAESNADAVWSHPFVKKLLTVAKYLGLK